MRTYSAYFSTLSTVNPTSGPAAQHSWLVNWRSIFGNRVGECRVRAKILSLSSTNLPWTADHVGSVRINFMSHTSNSNMGLILGAVHPVVDYLELDTTTSSGLTASIPDFMSQAGHITVSFYDATETLMTVVPEYQIWLYFDVDYDIPTQQNVEPSPASYF